MARLPSVASRYTLWTFTGIRGVELSPGTEFPLAKGLSIIPTSPFILSRWCCDDLNLHQQQAMKNVGHYLVYKSPTLPRDPIDERRARNRLLTALIAIQIVKPSRTLGSVLQLIEKDSGEPSIGPSEARSPMDPGQWPSLRHLDTPLLEQSVGTIAKVDAVMAGTDVRMKNAINLFQLALEHHHPAIACLLAVASVEACLDTRNAAGFERGLCDLLGARSPVFPDWNRPEFEHPPYTVEQLGFTLHRLRSTIVHGNDLRSATGKNGETIDFRQLQDFVDEERKPTYVQLLCEASICLTCQVLAKSL